MFSGRCSLCCCVRLTALGGLQESWKEVSTVSHSFSGGEDSGGLEPASRLSRWASLLTCTYSLTYKTTSAWAHTTAATGVSPVAWWGSLPGAPTKYIHTCCWKMPAFSEHLQTRMGLLPFYLPPYSAWIHLLNQLHCKYSPASLSFWRYLGDLPRSLFSRHSLYQK